MRKPSSRQKEHLLPSERTKRALVQTLLLPLRIAAVAYWYAGGRVIHTSRSEEAALRRARRKASERQAPGGTEKGDR
ncbi:hypothetical protein [Actinacidiphila sp. bgisy160]|uniref:hypothetical protein n=1 Tax=Actinacidiphila sp. bgisy160 TaxID=3413796 RepID=UPI003D725F70